MRNRFPGTCYRCGEQVQPNHGHFERHEGRWRHQHVKCAIRWRGTPQHYQGPDFRNDPEALERWKAEQEQAAERRSA